MAQTLKSDVLKAELCRSLQSDAKACLSQQSGVPSAAPVPQIESVLEQDSEDEEDGAVQSESKVPAAAAASAAVSAPRVVTTVIPAPSSSAHAAAAAAAAAAAPSSLDNFAQLDMFKAKLSKAITDLVEKDKQIKALTAAVAEKEKAALAKDEEIAKLKAQLLAAVSSSSHP